MAAGTAGAAAYGRGPTYAGTPTGDDYAAAGTAAGSYPPGGGPPGELPLHRAPERRRRLLAPIVAGAAVIALGVAAIIALSPDDDENPNEASPSGSDADQSTTTTEASSDPNAPPATEPLPTALEEGPRTEVAGGADGLAFDDAGRLWVASNDPDQLTVLESPNDEGSGRQDIPAADLPGGEDPDPLGVVHADGAIWVTFRNTSTIARIDPEAGPESAETFDVPLGPEFVTEGGGYIWVVSNQSSPATSGAVPTVTRIDPGTGDTIQEQVEGAKAVVVVDGRVWVTDNVNNVVRPYTVELQEDGGAITVGDSPDEIAFGHDRLWVANRGDGTVSRVDPGTGDVENIDVPGSPAGIEADDAFVYVVDTDAAPDDPNVDDGRVVLLNGETGEYVTDLALGRRPLGLTVREGSAWVSLQSGEVVRVDPA